MKAAFWDSSALVPLCVTQDASGKGKSLTAQYSFVVWWATRVEIVSAIARLHRMGLISSTEAANGRIVLEELRRSWREVLPTNEIGDDAEQLLGRFSLRAADALQLGAAMAWCRGRPYGKTFISGDAQLLSAALQIGFEVVEA